ncbi:hypothetical protein [Pseudoalteromonas sp. 1181_04]|uniref:hypothetical protein n=1 Tax=Pseudoalteromonas sp. 1181_04 TaxID=2604450 RepID=UPI0040631CAC
MKKNMLTLLGIACIGIAAFLYFKMSSHINVSKWYQNDGYQYLNSIPTFKELVQGRGGTRALGQPYVFIDSEGKGLTFLMKAPRLTRGPKGSLLYGLDLGLFEEYTYQEYKFEVNGKWVKYETENFNNTSFLSPATNEGFQYVVNAFAEGRVEIKNEYDEVAIFNGTGLWQAIENQVDYNGKLKGAI